MKKVLMAEMNWFEYMEALKETDTVIVPIGSTEILGTHCPLGTDHILAHDLSKRLGEMTQCIVSPTIPVGDAMEFMSWPGTITIRSQVLQELYWDICESLVKHGIKRIFFFNNHLSNIPAVAAVGRRMRRKGILVAQVDVWRVIFLVSDDTIKSDLFPKGHGGEVTTDVIMAVRPDLVDLNKATPEAAKPAFDFHTKYTKYSIFTYPDFRDFCDSGGWGDPSYASKEKGEKIIERALNLIADFLRDFKAQPYPSPLE